MPGIEENPIISCAHGPEHHEAYHLKLSETVLYIYPRLKPILAFIG